MDAPIAFSPDEYDKSVKIEEVAVSVFALVSPAIAWECDRQT